MMRPKYILVTLFFIALSLKNFSQEKTQPQKDSTASKQVNTKPNPSAFEKEIKALKQKNKALTNQLDKLSAENKELLSTTDTLKSNLELTKQDFNNRLEQSKVELTKSVNDKKDLDAQLKSYREKEDLVIKNKELIIISFFILSILLMGLAYLIWKQSKGQNTLLNTLATKAGSMQVSENGREITALKDQKVDDKIQNLHKQFVEDITVIKDKGNKLFDFVDRKIKSLKKQDNKNNSKIIANLEVFQSEVNKLLEKIQETVYNRRNCFITPNIVNPRLELLGRELHHLLPESSSKDFNNILFPIKGKRDEIKEAIEALNKKEKNIESEILEKSIEKLQIFNKILVSIAEEAAAYYRLKHTVNEFLEGRGKHNNKYITEDEKPYYKTLHNAYKVIYKTLYDFLNQTGLLTTYEPKIGDPLPYINGSDIDIDERVKGVGGGVYHADPAKNETIAEVYNPAFIVAGNVLVPAEILVYSNSLAIKARDEKRNQK